MSPSDASRAELLATRVGLVEQLPEPLDVGDIEGDGGRLELATDAVQAIRIAAR